MADRLSLLGDAPTDASARDRPSLHALTSLRFFAAFAVVVLHYRDLLGPLPEGVRQLIVGGQFGVTFFFVLSGFILTYRYREWFSGGVSDSRFWWFQRFRLARIYPIYLLGLLLDTPWHLLERASVGQLGDVAHTYWASWLLNAAALQAWVPAVPFAMFWNTPAWSVSAEFFFYATFPWVCATLCKRTRSRSWLVGAMLLTVMLGAALYAVVIYAMNYVWRVDGTTQYLVITYNPLLRFSEFLAGCIAGHAFLMAQETGGRAAPRLHTAGRRHLLLGVCLLVVLARVMVPGYTGPSAALWLLDVSTKYAVFIPPFVGLILAVASGRTCLSPMLEYRWLVLLGEASYSLYIVHWSVVTVLSMKLIGPLGTPWMHAVALLATVVFSVLCFYFVEVPLRRRLRGHSPLEPAKHPPIAVAMPTATRPASL